MSDYCIPLDIQKEIIKRVSDVKSLIRFRSVSKPWKSFIDSSKFIQGYGARDTQPHSCSILSYKENTSDDEAKYICFVDDDDDVDNNETLFKVVQSVVVSPQMEQYSCKKVVGACHGLLCLYGFHKGYEKWMFVIWNPSIRKSICIVVPNDSFFSTAIFGFGVCPVTRDPTFVKFEYCSYHDTWSVEVFTLSSGVWNVIPSSNLPRKSISFSETQVVIDRFIYWGACEMTYADDGAYILNHKLVSFDLITKEFRVLDLPDSLTNELYGDFFVSVYKLRESLVVYGYILIEEVLCCGVWVMENDSSFIKLFTIGADTVGNMLGFKKSGEPIFEAWKDYRELTTTLDVYDPSSQQIKNLGIVGAKDSFFMGSYKESLLLLDHPDSLIYPDGWRSTRRGGGCSGAGCSGGSRESGGSSRSVGQQAADSQSLSGVLAHVRVNYRDRVDANRLFYFTRLLDANPSVIPLFMDLATHEERLQFFEDLDLDPYIPRTHN